MSDTLHKELQELILSAAEKEDWQGDLSVDEALFGSESRLQLDSLDALQISMALQSRFGVRLADSKETRRALSSIRMLGEYLQSLDKV